MSGVNLSYDSSRGYNVGDAYAVLGKFIFGAQIAPGTTSTYLTKVGVGANDTLASADYTSLDMVDAAIRYYSCYDSLEDATNALRYKGAQIHNKYLTEQGIASAHTYTSNVASSSFTRNAAVLAAGDSLIYGWRKQITLNGLKFYVLQQNYGITNTSGYNGGIHYASRSQSGDSEATLYKDHFTGLAYYFAKHCLGFPDIHPSGEDYLHLDMGTLFGSGFTGADASSQMNSCKRRLAELIQTTYTGKNWVGMGLPDLPEGKVIKPLTYENCVALIQGTDPYAMQIPMEDIRKCLQRFGISKVSSKTLDALTTDDAQAIADALNSKSAFNSGEKFDSTKGVHSKLEFSYDPDLVTPNIKLARPEQYEPEEGYKYFEVRGVRYYYPARYFKIWSTFTGSSSSSYNYIMEPIKAACGSYKMTGNTGFIKWTSANSNGTPTDSSRPDGQIERLTEVDMLSHSALEAKIASKFGISSDAATLTDAQYTTCKTYHNTLFDEYEAYALGDADSPPAAPTSTSTLINKAKSCVYENDVTNGYQVTYNNWQNNKFVRLRDLTCLQGVQAANYYCNNFLRVAYFYMLPEIERIFQLINCSCGPVFCHRRGTHGQAPHVTIFMKPNTTYSPLYHTSDYPYYTGGYKSSTSYGTAHFGGGARRIELESGDIFRYYVPTSNSTVKPKIEYTSTGSYPLVDKKYDADTFWLLTHELCHQSRGHTPGFGGWLNEGMSDTVWGTFDGHRSALYVTDLTGLWSLAQSVFSPFNSWGDTIAYNLDGTPQTFKVKETVKSGSLDTDTGRATATLCFPVAGTTASTAYPQATEPANAVSFSATGANVSAINGYQITVDAGSTNITVTYTAVSRLPDVWWQYSGGSMFIRWLIWSVMQGWDKQWADNGHTHFPTDSQWSITKPYYTPSTGTYG